MNFPENFLNVILCFYYLVKYSYDRFHYLKRHVELVFQLVLPISDP